MANNIPLAISMALLVMVFMSVTADSIPCHKIETMLQGCVGYVQTGGAVVPPQCCEGMKDLKKVNKNAHNRFTSCKCIKRLVNKIPGAHKDLVEGIPKKCNVDIGLPLDLSASCSKYVLYHSA
ncbi:hypothetical protein KSP40_PGU005264 [Platanthera guangdongensis]|uniref:Bifunctional inhibitor/plant lipid transfer protein/seed storage helical domain-containing protein n=1 Tax=Platanthera guangdongensis TaxID=2320717 RepID=A0ABR2MYF8_9ASPA